MAHDAFISHSSTDKPIADAVCATLEARGVRCWCAPRDVVGGMDWSAEIIDAIGASRVLVLIFTAPANESPQVKREVERAVSRGLPIIPFRVEDVPLSKHMEFFISTPHWLDAMTPPLEAHLDRLADTVTVVLERSGARLPDAAPRPAAAVRPAPAQPRPAWKPPPEVEAWEARLIDALRPVLRPTESPAGEEPPTAGMIAAFAVGVLGVLSGLSGLFRVAVPGQGEAALFQMFPLLRLVNLFGTVAGTAGSLALIVGADWLLRRRPDARGVALGACRLLAFTTLAWFLLALVSFQSNSMAATQLSMSASTFGVALTGWAMQGVTYFLLRPSREPAPES